jgi:LysR family transcriptional regulator, glycine cleavage system transcriptional activator
MAMRPPPLQSLWAFHLVAETGSVTAAAAALQVTQPAVSRRLRELEQQLGCALVRRGPNALSLTEQGAHFAQELRQGFAQIEAAARGLRAQTAPLRIRAYTTWALRWLIPRLAEFKRAHPSMDVEVSTSTASVDLAREGVDAAIRTAPLETPPGPRVLRLQPVRIAPFAAPALAGGAAPRRLLGSRVRPRDWAVWHRHAGLPDHTAPLLFESTTLAIQAAVEGLGVVICSPGFVREEVRTGRLVPLAEGAAMTGDCYWLVLPQGRISPSLQLFADWLVQEAAVEDAASPPGPRARQGGRRRKAGV